MKNLQSFANTVAIFLSSRTDTNEENDLCEDACYYICNFEISCIIDLGALNPSP